MYQLLEHNWQRVCSMDSSAEVAHIFDVSVEQINNGQTFCTDLFCQTHAGMYSTELVSGAKSEVGVAK